MSTALASVQPSPPAASASASAAESRARRPLATRIALAALTFSANAALLFALTVGGAAEAEPSGSSPPAAAQKVEKTEAPEQLAPQKVAESASPAKPRAVRAKKFMPVRDFGGY